MSLLRLLTAGKSLVGLKTSEKRYHLPGQRALPKFGSKKNPFRVTTRPEQGEVGTADTPSAQVQPPAPPAEEKPQSRPQTSSSETTQASASASVAKPINSKPEADSGRQIKPLEPAERRPSGVRAFLLWGRAKAKGTALPGGRRLVTAELSLDKVKVVRNDLSESDVEIVGRASPPKPSESRAKPLAQESKDSVSESGWGAAAGRLLSLGKM